MSESTITDLLLNTASELIVEDKVKINKPLLSKILEDIRSMSDKSREEILSSMLKMHKFYEEECGDLDVSLNSNQEIIGNTEAWYVILDDSSTDDERIVRYHYKANWETSHGVEVIMVNAENLIYVGNCGYVSSIEEASSFDEEGFNFV